MAGGPRLGRVPAGTTLTLPLTTHPHHSPSPLTTQLPYNDYYEYYAPDFNLHVPPNPTMENANTRQYLEQVKQQVFENLRLLNGAPGVQMQQARLPTSPPAHPAPPPPPQTPHTPRTPACRTPRTRRSRP